MTEQEQRDWVFFMYPKAGTPLVPENAIAIGLYKDGKTLLAAMPDGRMSGVFKEYNKRVADGKIKHTSWQQFNKWIEASYGLPYDAFELTGDNESLARSMISHWDKVTDSVKS